MEDSKTKPKGKGSTLFSQDLRNIKIGSKYWNALRLVDLKGICKDLEILFSGRNKGELVESLSDYVFESAEAHTFISMLQANLASPAPKPKEKVVKASTVSKVELKAPIKNPKTLKSKSYSLKKREEAAQMFKDLILFIEKEIDPTYTEITLFSRELEIDRYHDYIEQNHAEGEIKWIQ